MNYSLDPTYRSRLAGIIDNVAPSPYAQLLQEDYDGTTNGMVDMLSRLASQSDTRGPVPPPNVTTADSDPEGSALSRGADIFGSILKAPFRLLGAGVEGLQDALGAPASYRREARSEYLDNVDRLGLASSALTAEQKAALGYQPGDVYADRPRKPGIWEVISGNAAKEQARKEARVMAVRRAIEMNFGGARTAAENAQALKFGADARKSWLEGNEVVPNNIEWRAVRAAERIKELAGAGAESARAGKERAQAGLYGSQTLTEDQNRDLGKTSFWQGYDQKGRAFEQDYDQKGRAFEQDQTMRAQAFRNKEIADATELGLKEKEFGLKSTANDAYIRGQNPTTKGATFEDVAKADTDRRDLFQRTYNAALKSTSDEQTALKLAAAVAGVNLKKLNDGWFGSTVGGTTVPVFPSAPSPNSFGATSFQPTRSTFTPSPSEGETHDTYLKLKNANPSLDEGALRSRAEELNRILPTLDRSSELAFYTAAKQAGLSKTEAATFWGAGRK